MQFSVNEVSDMMKKIGYDNVAMEFYFKESNTELDKVDHSVYKEPVNVDHSISKAIILYEPSNSDKFLDNDADEVLDDISEDEWQERNRNVHNLVITEHVANKGNAVSEDESESEYGSNSDDSDFIVDEENLIHDVDDFDSGTHSWNEGVRKKAIRQLGKINKAAAVASLKSKIGSKASNDALGSAMYQAKE
ncbi:hypothetical protein Tco_0873788 [Tanacetum coccineum]|uniref:Uncharacterized protein n=1 Tax=Tanacetum coccineum TaxID=301880 RepID=A0ABQ5BMN2_9ASTR